MSRTVAVIEGEIAAIKEANPNWLVDAGDKALITALTIEKNQLAASTTASTVALTSPRRINAVWVLAKVVGPKAKQCLLPIGTCFAVRCRSMNKLLSAHHNFTDKIILKDRITNREIRHYYRTLINLEYVLIRGMVRENGDVMVTGSEEGEYEEIPVKWLTGDNNLDWAVLERADGMKFPDEETCTIPICELKQLPKIEDEPKVKIYHVNVSAFTDPDPRSDLLSVEVTPPTVVSQRTRHHLNMPHGVFSGSSGGAVVDRLGRAVGIVVESWSPISVTEVYNDMKQDERDSAFNSSMNSIMNSYNTYSISVIPSTVPELMTALELLN